MYMQPEGQRKVGRPRATSSDEVGIGYLLGSSSESRRVEETSQRGQVSGVAALLMLMMMMVTYSECVSVVLVIQHAKRMRRIILLSVTSLALLFFSTLSHKWYDFRKKKVIEHEVCGLILSTIVV